MKQDSDPHDFLVALLLVQNAMQRRSDAFFQAFSLTDAQFNILNLLGYHDGKMDQAALVDQLLVGKSSISIVLNRMVRDGLVKREEHPKDRRQTVLILTPKGRSLWRKVAPQYDKGVREVFGSMPTKKRDAFLNELETLYAALKRDVEMSEKEKPFVSLREFIRQLSRSF